jgi:hypothetical protein
MISFFIIAGFLLLIIYIAIKEDDFKRRIGHLLMIVGVCFLLFTGYMIFSGKEINFTSIGGISNAAKTYFSWFSIAGKNIARVTSYALNQEWKADETNSTGIS